jgi:hypothetical protein
MKYVLGLGLKINQKYKKNSTVRVFIDESFIDEYEIDSADTASTPVIIEELCYWFPKSNIKTLPKEDFFVQCPKHWKTYVIDDSIIKNSNEIRLVIDNDDTNYTNGFLTNSTLLDLRHVFLLPSDFFNHFHSNAKTFFQNINSIIPKKYKGVAKFERSHFIKSPEGWGFVNNILGYPYPFRYKWQSNSIQQGDFESVGGSGVLTLDLCRKNNISTFETYEKDLTFFEKYGYHNSYHVEKMLETYGCTQQEIIELVNKTPTNFDDEFTNRAKDLELTSEEIAKHYEKMQNEDYLRGNDKRQFVKAIQNATATGMDKVKVGDQEYTIKDAMKIVLLQHVLLSKSVIPAFPINKIFFGIVRHFDVDK